MVKIKNWINDVFIWLVLVVIVTCSIIYLLYIYLIDTISNVYYNLKFKIKSKINKNTKKKLVLLVANEMCSKNNKLSTKELKIELRNRFPEETWNKYDGGSGVSDLFHVLVSEGHFVSIADNGTYQTYASRSFPIKDMSGAPYIPDMEEHIATAAANLGKSLAKASRRSKAISRTVPASPANTVTVTKKAKGGSGQGKTNLPQISRSKALELMKNNKGRFFTAVFIKKEDGSERTINCRYLKDQALSQLGYVKVTDEALRKVDPKNCIRNVNLQTLKTISIGGTRYKIK